MRGWRRPIVAAALALVVTIPSALGAPAHAKGKQGGGDGWTYTDVPVSLEIVNPCNGEAVTVSGSMRAKVKTIDKDGSFSYEYHSEYGKLRGKSATGRKYMADGSNDYTFTVVGPGPHQALFVHEFSLKGQGPKNDFSLRNTFRTTFDANLNVVAEAVDTRLRCK